MLFSRTSIYGGTSLAGDETSASEEVHGRHQPASRTCSVKGLSSTGGK